MPVYKSLPQFRITVSASAYGGGATTTWINDQCIGGTITRNENGFDTAILTLSDYQAKNFIGALTVDSTIVVDFKDASETNWTEVFDGIIRFIDLPFGTADLMVLHCDGKGFPLGEMLCSGQFGTQSTNSTLDTIQEIITDANEGIIPEYVNDILNTGVSSNHSITATTTTVQNIAGSMRYLYFPFKPCSKAINDVCDILQAIKGTGAGPHWIVDTAGNFLLCTLNADHPDAANNGWYKYYQNSVTSATLSQGVDFTNFFFQKLSREANYIVYHGATVRPMDLDALTNSYAASWSLSNATSANDNANYKVGADSVHVTENTGGVANWVLSGAPLAGGWNINAIGGKYNIPIIHFWSRIDADTWNNNEGVRFSFFPAAGVSATAYIATPISTSILAQSIFQAANEWQEIVLPIGAYANSNKTLGPKWFDGWETGVAISWASVGHFGSYWYSNTNTQEIWFDGIYIKGNVIRVAKDSTIGATNPVKMKIITDDVAKDDLWRSGTPGTTDLGIIAQLAKAELLRCKNTPLVGWAIVPYLYDLLPGQILHIHAKKKDDGTFRIDTDMRVTSLSHNFSTTEFLTTIYLTDDLTNSLTRSAYNEFNKLMSSIRPEFQDRQATSIKTREIDITQTILEESY